MVTLSKIYTRTGDDGTTGLVGGTRVKKTAPRVQAYGDLDELNAHIGLCVTLASQKGITAIASNLSIIQNELFDLGSELACPQGIAGPGIPSTSPEQVTKLEELIDLFNKDLPALNSFVLPGGSLLNAHLHIARTICRRAERSILSLHEDESVPEATRHYINRLSDLLFVMSRAASTHEGIKEYLWVPGGTRQPARQQ